MLSLLLTLLKIVGILMLILLGLLLLTALALIFAPFRYELEAKCTSLEDLEVKGRFSWLLRFISVRGFYRNGEMSVWLKILGIPVFRMPETEKKRRKNERKQKKRAEKERRSREKKREKEKSALEIGETSGEAETIGGFIPDGPVIRGGGEPEMQIPGGRTQEGDLPGKPDTQAKGADLRQDETNFSRQDAQPDRDSKFRKEDKPQTKKIEKKKRKQKRFSRKKKKEPRDTRTDSSGWRDKLEKGLDFIQDPDNRKMFAFLKEQVFAVLHHILPGRFEIEARIGLEDPAATGTALALVYMLYPFYGDHIRLVGEFEEVVLEGRLYLRGRIRILTLLIIGLKIYRNKTVRGLLN